MSHGSHCSGHYPDIILLSQLVNIGSDNGLVPSGTKPLLEPMFRATHLNIRHPYITHVETDHQDSSSSNNLQDTISCYHNQKYTDGLCKVYCTSYLTSILGQFTSALHSQVWTLGGKRITLFIYMRNENDKKYWWSCIGFCYMQHGMGTSWKISSLPSKHVSLL